MGFVSVVSIESTDMADIRSVTDGFSVSPQIALDDVQAVADAGFKTIICNRPDGEEDGQPTIAALKDASEAAGLTFLALPFSGTPSEQIADQMGTLIETAEGPVLGFCRSGTRSITAWALAQRGQGRGETIAAQGAAAGYDLSGLLTIL